MARAGVRWRGRAKAARFIKAPMRKQGENVASILKQRGFTPGSRLGALMRRS